MKARNLLTSFIIPAAAIWVFAGFAPGCAPESQSNPEGTDPTDAAEPERFYSAGAMPADNGAEDTEAETDWGTDADEDAQGPGEEVACEKDGISCTAHCQSYDGTAPFDVFGNCLDADGNEASFDGDADHNLSQAELASLCESMLEEMTESAPKTGEVTCEDGDISCRIIVAEDPDLTSNYNFGGSCTTKDPSQPDFAFDGTADHELTSKELMDICENAIDSVKAESNQPAETTCQREEISCLAHYAVAEDGASYALEGSCSDGTGAASTFDGEIDHEPSPDELTDICESYLSEVLDSPGEPEHDLQKQEEPLTNCSFQNLSGSHGKSLWSILLSVFIG